MIQANELTRALDLGYAGKFLRDSEKPSLLRRLTAGILFPSAVITTSKKYPDVSFYQGDIDWDKMRAQTDTVIIRAGQNVWVDSKFNYNYREAAIRGMLRGVYWFYDDRVDPQTQVNILASLIQYDLPELEVFVDWERTYGGSYSRLAHVIQFMKLLEQRLPSVMVGVYTGYYWFKDHSVGMSAEDAAYLKTHALWLAWYTSNPAYVLIPYPWTVITHWQYGTPAIGANYGVRSNEIDMNWFNGEVAAFYEKYGVIDPIPQPGDEMIMTHEGVYCHQIRRFETDCFIHIIDLTKVTAKIKTGFRTVPDAAEEFGAILAFNMGGWGDLPNQSAADEYLIVEGQVVQSQMTGSGWIELKRNDTILISDGQPNFQASWNVWGFDRIIAKDGVYNYRITNPFAEPRTINGKTRDGKLVILTCEGRRPGQKGLTFPEVWSVMQEFDVIDCGNADGGYSSASWDNYFDPPLLNSTYLVENRRVVSQLLFFPRDTTVPPDDGGSMAGAGTYRIIVPETQERNGPGISEPLTGRIYHSGDIVEITQIQQNTPGVAEWGQLVNGKWIATTWNSRVRVELVEATPPDPGDPPPPTDPVVLPDHLDMTAIITNFGGLTYKGTLTKQ